MDPDIDVFTKNYDYDLKYRSNREELAKQIYDDKPRKITNDGTDKILNQWQTNTFSKIFSQLDSDQDNIISCYNVNTSALSKELNQIISPIVQEMKQENETLTQEEFVKAMYHLYEVRSYIILSYLTTMIERLCYIITRKKEPNTAALTIIAMLVKHQK
jgi:hypothetical protein